MRCQKKKKKKKKKKRSLKKLHDNSNLVKISAIEFVIPRHSASVSTRQICSVARIDLHIRLLRRIRFLFGLASPDSVIILSVGFEFENQIHSTYNFQFFIAETEDKTKNETNEEDKKKYPYPKSVFLIISTEFCERFSFYGMKSK